MIWAYGLNLMSLGRKKVELMNGINIKMKDLEHKCYKSVRLNYRPLELSDCYDVYEHGKDAENCKFLKWGPYKGVEEAEAFIYNKIREDDLIWGIVEKRENKVIGAIRIYDYIDIERSISISYILNRKYSGNGYMTESLKTMFGIAQKIFPIDVIYAYYAVENIKSQNVMIRAGMTSDSFYEEQILVKNRWLTYKRYFIKVIRENSGTENL